MTSSLSKSVFSPLTIFKRHTLERQQFTVVTSVHMRVQSSLCWSGTLVLISVCVVRGRVMCDTPWSCGKSGRGGGNPGGSTEIQAHQTAASHTPEEEEERITRLCDNM